MRGELTSHKRLFNSPPQFSRLGTLHCGDGGGFFFLLFICLGWYAMQNNSMRVTMMFLTTPVARTCASSGYQALPFTGGAWG